MISQAFDQTGLNPTSPALFQSFLGIIGGSTLVMRSLIKLLGTLKSNLRFLNKRNAYSEIEKTESMRMDMMHRKAQASIVPTLKNADYRRKKSHAHSR
ncbi:hypothetical protein ACFX19_011319 [Malus domestica]